MVECCPLLLGHNDICISSLYDTYSITVLSNANIKANIFLLTAFLTLQSPHPFPKTLSGWTLATVRRFDSYFWWSNAYVTSILFPLTTLIRSSTTKQRPVPNMDISYSSLLACYYYPTIPPKNYPLSAATNSKYHWRQVVVSCTMVANWYTTIPAYFRTKVFTLL